MTYYDVQKHTSADTSLDQVPALMKKIIFPRGSKVLDYGGGKYDTATEYMRGLGVEMRVYDPYNRSPSHNDAVLRWGKAGNPDFITCANVLNVIDSRDAMITVLHNLRMLAAKHDIPVYISVYEGDRKGIGRETTKGWQRNEPASNYKPMIDRLFICKRHGNIFECRVREN